MSTLYLDYHLDNEKILWKAKLKYKKKLYKSKLHKNILACLLDIRNQISKHINKNLYFSISYTKKLKSYVIYKFIKNNEIVNKKKVILQINESCKISCKKIKNKFNINPKNDFELFVFIEDCIKKNFINVYDSFIKSSCIKLFIDFKENIKIPDELCEQDRTCNYNNFKPPPSFLFGDDDW